MNTEVSHYWKTANSCRQLSHRLQLCLFFCLTTVLEIDLFEQELPLNLHFPFQHQQHTVKPIHCPSSIRRLAEKHAVLNKWGGGASVSVQYNTSVLQAQRRYGSSERRQMRDRTSTYKCSIYAALFWNRIQTMRYAQWQMSWLRLLLIWSDSAADLMGRSSEVCVTSATIRSSISLLLLLLTNLSYRRCRIILWTGPPVHVRAHTSFTRTSGRSHSLQ